MLKKRFTGILNIKQMFKYMFSKQFLIDKYLIIALVVTLEFNDVLARIMMEEIDVIFRPMLSNLIVISVMMLIVVLMPKKHQAKTIWLFMFSSSVIAMANYVYYSYFGNFLTLGQVAQATQLNDVKESIALLLSWKMLLFFILPVSFYMGYRKLSRKVDLAPIHSRRKGISYVIFSIVVTLFINLLLLTGSDVSRITKLWNRELVVSTFGIYTYQISDTYKVVSDRFFTDVETADEAQKNFDLFYSEEQMAHIPNEYTGMFEGRDVYFIHYESAQDFVVDKEINGQEITPTLNRLKSEGIYFSNFYSQESYGTSSDTEFTISTSLLPRNDGTVFITDNNKNFVTTEKYLRDKDYGVYAFHGNKITFWYRDLMLPNFGYTELFGKEELGYTKDEILGPYGIADEFFYEKTVENINEIKQENPDKPIYAQLITLTNHHPFQAGSSASKLDVGEFEQYSTEMSNYLKSYNYADEQLQLFFDRMDYYGLLDNAVVVIYGDHPASIPKAGYSAFLNYNSDSGLLTTEDTEGYVSLDNNVLRDLKSVPFLIWTKDQALEPAVVNDVAGMVDVSTTMNNLLGVHNPYTLGFDLLEGRTMPIVFMDGSWKTNDTYYDAKKGDVYGVILSEEEIKAYNEYAFKLIELSKNIIYHDLQADVVDFKYDDEN